jgi:hypothetical protein
MQKKSTPYYCQEGAKLDIMVGGKITGLIMKTHNAFMKPDGKEGVDIKSDF